MTFEDPNEGMIGGVRSDNFKEDHVQQRERLVETKLVTRLRGRIESLITVLSHS